MDLLAHLFIPVRVGSGGVLPVVGEGEDLHHRVQAIPQALCALRAVQGGWLEGLAGAYSGVQCTTQQMSELHFVPSDCVRCACC